MSQVNIPVKTYYNDLTIPIIGFGTFKANDEVKLVEAIKEAVKAGYRHLDCAWAYRNEAVVGRALRESIEESNGKLKREDFFITGKIWNTHHSRDLTRKCLQETLDSLGTSYVDLILVHWPFGYAENTGKEPFPFDDNGKMRYSDVHYLETYHALEELLKEGKTKAIGISNFNIEQIEDVLNNSEIKPAMLQIEVNVYNQNRELIEYAQSKGIQVTAYAPLGANDRGWMKPEDPIVLQDETINALAKKYNRSAAQICIKWILQQNIVILVKSVTPQRLLENANVFDFTLADEDLEAIRNIKRKFRYYVIVPAKEHKLYPFKAELVQN